MDVQGTEMIEKQLWRSFRKGQEAAPLFYVTENSEEFPVT